MHELQFGISLQALRASWGNKRRGEGCDEKQYCVYWNTSQVIWVVAAFLHLHVGFSCQCTSWRNRISPWKQEADSWKSHRDLRAPNSPTLLLTDGGRLQPPPSRELTPWLYQTMPHIWGKDHPLQPTKEKRNKENLPVNIILVKWHHMSPLWRCIQKCLGRVVPKPSTGTAPHLSTAPSAGWLGETSHR